MTATRATVVVQVDGKEVARRQVRVEDGGTVVVDVPLADVATPAVIEKFAGKVRAQFRATAGGKE